MPALEMVAMKAMEAATAKVATDISVSAATDIAHKQIVSDATFASVEQRTLSQAIGDIGHKDFRIGEVDTPEIQNKEVYQLRELNAAYDLGKKIEVPSWNDKILPSDTVEKTFSVESGKDSFLLNGELPENSKIIINNQDGQNVITVKTDEFGRHQTIDIDSIQKFDGTRDLYQQQRCCGLKDGLASDDASHILAREFGGPSEQFNLLPQDSYVNRFGEQRLMERSWGKILDNGGTVKDVHIEVNYVEGTNSFRPTGYEISCKENGVQTSYFIDNSPRSNDVSKTISNSSDIKPLYNSIKGA